MAFVKGKLKAARDAIGKKDYPTAREAASQVLEYEPENYNAHVFLGLALLELGETAKSEQAYQKATALNPQHPLAFQGLSRLYEKTEEWASYAKTSRTLAELYSKLGDPVKCAEASQKYLEIRREHGTRQDIIDALYLFLPGSSVFGAISELPPPDPTNPAASTTSVASSAVQNSLPILEEIVAIIEKDQQDTMVQELSKRRMRLGAGPPEQLKKEIALEQLENSKLPSLYEEVINHPYTSDELRRLTESKLLQLKVDYMHALPTSSPLKSKVATEVETMVDGIVLLNIPNELAWSLYIEGINTDSIAGYEFSTLRRFMSLFADSASGKLLRAYFTVTNISVEDDEEENKSPGGEALSEDAFDDLVDAFNQTPNSILAHRLLADVYDIEKDYENAIKVAESGLELVHRAETDRARKLPNVRKAFNVVLATALIHLLPPKHHGRALGILSDVLALEADNIRCLMGRGYVFESAENWDGAVNTFGRVVDLIPDDIDDGLRAQEEKSWSLAQLGDRETARESLQKVVETIDALDDRDLDKARCWWKLGRVCWEMKDTHRDEAYRCFITALKRSSDFAPAFTSLGIYYSEHVVPPDPARASKCFQKAFELDPREADAARRLAIGFADDREWDLVEIVARRTIQGEGGPESGKEIAAVSRYLPKNVWAWKAIGVVELNRRNYSAAIQALNISLRAEPDDHVSWVRLGEAYSKAGRHAAAAKALEHALDLNDDDWMCAYLTGDVERATGRFEEAIEAFRVVLFDRPGEVGVTMALAQTHLDLGRSEAALGFEARAEESFQNAIFASIEAIDRSPGFRHMAWKMIGDALVLLSQRYVYSDGPSLLETLSFLMRYLPSEVGPHISGMIPPPAIPKESPVRGSSILAWALAAYDYRLSLLTHEGDAQGSAWADLGMALHAWSQTTLDSEKKEIVIKSAITCTTEALKSDAGNDSYWNLLGTLTFSSRPRTAQHAFIKAIEIDNKNVVTWTNLGLLYLHHGDLPLANEALHRAQTLDPDYTSAWVGQGLVATANGHDVDARNLFEHAVSLAADVPAADLEFAARAFATHVPGSDIDTLLPVFSVLQRYCAARPADACGAHLFALVCERVGHAELGAAQAERAASLLEAAYEASEDTAIEHAFVRASASAGRLALARGDRDRALEAFATASGLLGVNEEGGDEASGASEDHVLRVQCALGSGIAKLGNGQIAEALDDFEAGVREAGEDPTLRGHATVLLSQALWALGSPESRESAKAQLLQCVADDPDNLMATNTLAGMGILSGDAGLVDAALSEIIGVSPERRKALDPGREVAYLLTRHQLSQGDANGALAVLQAAAHVEPSASRVRTELARLLLQRGEPSQAIAVLGGPGGTGDTSVERRTLALRAVAETSPALAQRAVVLTPWDRDNWSALAYVRGISEIREVR